MSEPASINNLAVSKFPFMAVIKSGVDKESELYQLSKF